jgi:hypothetical protein
MSVWPESSVSRSGTLTGAEGELVSASIAVEPQSLERLLETLAEVSFPINPQIYHNATVAYRYPDGREDTEPVTIVEFPAYSGQLDEVRSLLVRQGFDPDSLWVRNLLEEIHSSFDAEPAPPGVAFTMIVRRKHPPSGN